MRSVFLVALAVTCACQRSEQSQPSAEAPSGGSQSTSETPKASQDAGPVAAKHEPATPTASPGCVIPLADEPAPQAKPAQSCPADPATKLPELDRGYVTFTEASGTPRVAVEIANSGRERERGLMYRTSMPEDQGMLFSWNEESVRSFWMRNTCLPLDMLFITKEGFIAGILEQVPTLNERPRSIPCPVAHVLELNAGYARAHGLKPGTRVTFE
jgi:uncharacterized protein